MSAKRLIALARAHGLTACADLIGRADDVPEPAPPTVSGQPTPPDHPFAAIDAMRLSGLAPALVEGALKIFADRPLERGLFAWDVLTGAFVDEKLRDRLRKDAHVVAEVLPKTPQPLRCAAVRGVDLQALVRKTAMPPYEALPFEKQMPLAQLNALAAIEMFVSVDKDNKNSRMIRGTAAQFAHMLDWSHAPTLASFYLHYLWKRVGDDVVDRLLEVLADTGAEGKFTIDDVELGSVERIGYKAFRMSARHAGSLYESEPKASLSQSSDQLRVVWLHLGLMADDLPGKTELEALKTIIEAHQDWRYARRVSLGLTARWSPPSSELPLRVFDTFLATFGNVFDVWRDVSEYAPDGNVWIDKLSARLVHQMEHLPHDVEAWRAFGPMFLDGKDQQRWAEAIDARIAEQCKI